LLGKLINELVLVGIIRVLTTMLWDHLLWPATLVGVKIMP
jgi:hypothetical protein